MSEAIENAEVTEATEVTESETVETEVKTEETEKEPSWLKGRLDRHEKKIREEYKDYDQLKQLASDHESKIAEKDSEINSLKEQLQQYVVDTAKTKAAIKYGIPLEMASRINGTDEESIFEDAKSIAPMFKARQVAPLSSTETKFEDGVTAAFLKKNPNIKL